MVRLIQTFLCLSFVGSAVGFVAHVPGQPTFKRQGVVTMGLFDAIKKGFENEDFTQPPPNAGLKTGPTMVTITFKPANKVVQGVAGQPLKDIAAAAGVPIRYNCKKGECGTCEVTVNGNKARMCKAIVPRGARKNEVLIQVPPK